MTPGTSRAGGLLRLLARTLLGLVPMGAGSTEPSNLPPRTSDSPVYRPPDAVEMDPRVSRLDLDLSLDPSSGQILLEAELEVEGTNVTSLTCLLNEWLTIERSRASEGMIEHRKADVGKVTVRLDPPIQGRRIVSFRISGRPRRGSSELVQEDRVVLAPEDRWYPVVANTWAGTRVSIHAPEGWTVVAPGSRDATAPPGLWRWRAREPVRTVAVVGAPGLGLGEAALPRNPLRVASPDGPRDAKRLGSILATPVAWFAASLTPYPFDGLNLVLVSGLPYRVQAGGLVAVALETPLDGPSEAADLVAGQWFGERLAGDGVWIRAFAAWYATRFARQRALALPAEIERLRRAYFELPRGQDVALSRADPRAPEAVLRGKGSAAPEMVGITIGDRAVEQVIEELFASPVSAPMSLKQLQTVYERHAGAAVPRAFADWFDRSGAPEFETTLRTMPSSTGGWRADLVLVQRGGNYALPVEVVFVGIGQEHHEVIQVDGERTAVFYVLPFEPLRVKIDPLGKLFQRKLG
jgi:hypothetical protein